MQENFLTGRLGDISAQRELTKLFKPIKNTQKDMKETLVKEIKPLSEGIKELPAAITFPQLQAVAPHDEEEEEDEEGGVMRVDKTWSLSQ